MRTESRILECAAAMARGTTIRGGSRRASSPSGRRLKAHDAADEAGLESAATVDEARMLRPQELLRKQVHAESRARPLAADQVVAAPVGNQGQVPRPHLESIVLAEFERADPLGHHVETDGVGDRRHLQIPRIGEFGLAIEVTAEPDPMQDLVEPVVGRAGCGGADGGRHGTSMA